MKRKKIKRSTWKGKKGFKKNSGPTWKGMFSESLSYIRESQNFIYFGIILFFLSSAIAFFLPGHFSFIDKLLAQIAGQIDGLGVYELMIFIFKNNFLSAVFAVVFGVFLGIFPIFNSLFNGALLGYMFSRVIAEHGFFVLWRILPHGIFELPAIFIAIGVGIRLGLFVFAVDKKKEFLYRFDNALKVLVTVVLPLLIVAAIIESFLIAFF